MIVKLTKSIAVVLALSSFAVVNSVSASDNASQNSSQGTSQNNSKEDIETIGITGSVPLLFYKDDMQAAELDFYEMFNALNDNKKYKVLCRKETRLGSRIKTRVCYPQYVLDRMAEETQDALSSGAGYPSLQQIEFAVKDEREESMKYVEELVKSNPELLHKLIQLNEKQALYAQKKAQVYPD